jgi:hypothetical protein
VGQGFTVKASGLAAGGKDMADLLTTCEKVATDAVTAISGMGEAASGHAGLTAALLAAAERGTKTFLDISAAYQHVGTSLDATAGTYSKTESDNTSKVNAIWNGSAR